ncbi:hypothetical protein EYZ11_011438 [Aspergillus tanneri]|uniref:Uncharacterized protein n=1 Tax=Aspergillus tanneri TaxID=1220188 RepID=A0A4S3J840_9EURO|nr:hypothetical protein EYZ11_011438 [Aspergillus tanneri]
METRNYVLISDEISQDKAKLAEEAVNHFGSTFEESKVDVEESWASYNVRLFESALTERLVLFRPPPSSKVFGCIRVRDGQRTVKWEAVRKSGLYMGFIPNGCHFEAMLVDVRLITQKESSS